jgi:hypothetical protein
MPQSAGDLGDFYALRLKETLEIVACTSDGEICEKWGDYGGLSLSCSRGPGSDAYSARRMTTFAFHTRLRNTAQIPGFPPIGRTI